MSDARRDLADRITMLGPELVAAIESVVDARLEERLSEIRHEEGREWLTIAEAAEYARVSSRTLERLLTGGRVPSTTLGRRRLVRRGDLDAFLGATR